MACTAKRCGIGLFLCLKITNNKKGVEFDMRPTKIDSNSKRPEQKYRAEVMKKIETTKLQETAPRHLDRISSRLWTQLIPELNKSGLINESDKPVVEGFVMAYSMMRQAWESVKNNGTTYMSDSGRIYKNPSVDILSDQQTKLRMLGAELGLTPQSRANMIDLAMTDDSEEFDQVIKMFGGGN